MINLRRGLKLVAATAIFTFSTAMTAVAGNLTKFVNPYIGSGGHGHVFVGANVPFGMVQLGPTQPTRGWDWCSGYHYSDNVIIGFGHTHLSGTGIGDLGDIAVLPVKDAKQTVLSFSHDQETVRPGYYAVDIADPAVKVELTSTCRVGFHRYTFAPGAKTNLVAIDLKQGIGWDAMTDCLLNQETPTCITGMRRSKGWSADHRYYFSMEFSKPVTIVNRDEFSRIVVSAEADGKPLLVKVALSPIDIMGAKANMKAELPGWDFDATVNTADAQWEKQLARVTVEGNNDVQKTIFYTAMYHFMIAPSVFCDANGDYRGADGQVHHADYTTYSTFSLWDAYRAAYPLMTLVCPDMQNDLANTFMSIYREQGKLPVWHLAGCETDCMVGSPGVPILADLVLKGYVKDKAQAFEAIKNSRSFSKYFDPSTCFMRAIGTDGKFRTPFDPFDCSHRTNDYTEGNAWQYTFLVPHDVHGLVKLFGSEQRFVSKLDSLFTVEGSLGDNASPDVSGLLGQYAQGNEPSHHVIYMYNYVGQPWKAAPLLRRMMNEMYTDQPDGLSGNEDVGQMSAWYIISTMGLYQVEPSGGKFIIGSPLFDKATLNVGGGKSFTVRAINNSDKNMYVQKVRLNGKAYTKSYIDFKDIMRGGTLELTMGPKPSKWGTAVKDRP